MKSCHEVSYCYWRSIDLKLSLDPSKVVTGELLIKKITTGSSRWQFVELSSTPVRLCKVSSQL